MSIKVCIVLEGSYPYITGGVSAWVQDLIENLPDIDFVLFTISPEANQELRYTLPPNVVEHKDVILTKSGKQKTKNKNKKEMLQTVNDAHTRMFAGVDPDIKKLMEHMPENYFLYKDSVNENISWDLISKGSQEKNPLYPFSDYYWAWKSSHDMLFTVLGTEPPDADIYHAVSTGFAGIAALAAKIRRKKSFILTEHGLYHKEREIEIRKTNFVRGYQRDMWMKIYNRFSNLCYKNADIVTSLFEENRQKQLELGASKENTYVIPNGIDIKRFSVPRKERKGNFHVGLVGRVVPIKDIKTYIATAKIVLEAIPEAIFYCIGPSDEDPGYYEDCKLLVESLKIGDRFKFTGRQNVLEYYSFLDVVVLTSIREAQPLVILEAYSALVPIVATRVGNIPEMLDYDQRFIADSKDSEALAEGIIYIQKNPEVMKKINIQNRQKVLNFYDKKDLHKKYKDLYSSWSDTETGMGKK